MKTNCLALIVIFIQAFLFGCYGESQPPLAFSGGQLELSSEDNTAAPCPMMIQGENRLCCPLTEDGEFVSTWVTIPESCSLNLGYSFFFDTPEDKDWTPEGRQVTSRFLARLHILGGGTYDLMDQTTDSFPVHGWRDLFFDLSDHAGRAVRLELLASSPGAGAPGDYRDVKPVFSVPCLFGPDQARGHDGRLLLLVSLDSLRADALGCAGYDRATSPNLDRFCRDAVHYPTCLSPSPWTRPAHMSLLTSLYPQVHGLSKKTSELDLSSSFATWAEIFRDSGFQTLGFTGGGYVHPSRGFERGFRSIRSGRMKFADVCQDVARAAGQWRDTDLFVFLHTFTTHSPYHRDGPLDYHSAGITSKVRRFPPRKAGTMPREEGGLMRRYYDDGIFHADQCLGRLFWTLKREGLYHKAMIIVLSDHGEAFREHGVFGHSLHVYENMLKVPLLVKYPRDTGALQVPPPGSVIHRTVELLDLLPTAVEVYGVDTPAVDQFAGHSMLRTGVRDWIYAETYQFTPGLRAIRAGNLSYILHHDGGLEELYDLETDPDQIHNLAAGEREDGLSTMRGWLGLAESLGRAGLHLAVGCRGSAEGALEGRLRADCRIRGLTRFFPAERGRVTLSPDGRELRFAFDRLGEVPLDMAFELEDPSARLSVNLDQWSSDLPGPTVLLGSGHGGEGRPVSAEDQGLLLSWNSLPGPSPSSRGGAWVHLYRRHDALEGEKTVLSQRETDQLKELGYLE